MRYTGNINRRDMTDHTVIRRAQPEQIVCRVWPNANVRNTDTSNTSGLRRACHDRVQLIMIGLRSEQPADASAEGICYSRWIKTDLDKDAAFGRDLPRQRSLHCKYG